MNRRLISLFLALTLVLALVPAVTLGAGATSGDFHAYLESKYLRVGETAQIIVTGADPSETISYAEEDIVVAMHMGNGVISGERIGRTYVDVTVGTVTKKVDVIVVGPNLLVRNGVDHGSFDGGVYDPIVYPDSVTSENFWNNNSTATGAYSVQEFTLLEGQSTPWGENKNIAKWSFAAPGSTDTLRLRMQLFYSSGLHTGGSNMNGLIPVDSDKLYEYSGYIKSDNTVTLATDFGGQLFYYNGATFITNSHRAVAPWTGKSGNRDWTEFIVPSFPLTGYSSYTELGADPRVESTMRTKTGDLYAGNLSLHEVIFDSVKFVPNATIPANLGKATIPTNVKLLSNTGTPIGNAKDVASGTEIPNIITYESSNEDVATVSSEGVITTYGVIGTAQISATATICGESQTGTIDINVTSTGETELPRPLVYNYYKLSTYRAGVSGATSNQGLDIRTITSFNMTTAGDPLEIHPGVAAIATDPWYYVGIGGGATSCSYASNAYGLMFDKGAGAWCRIAVRVPISGLYTASAVNGLWAAGGIVRTYLAPMEDENPTAREYCLGKIDTYSSSAAWLTEKKLDTVYLNAGDYYLTYETVGRNASASDARYAVSAFKLTPAAEELEKEYTVSSLPELKAGNIATVSVKCELSDDSMCRDGYNASVSATPRNADVVSVSVSDDKAKSGAEISVSALAAGSTYIDVTVMENNVTVLTKAVPVTVKPALELNSISLSVEDASNLHVARHTSHKVSFLMYDAENEPIVSGEPLMVLSSDNPNVTIDGDTFTVAANGSATINASVTLESVTKTSSITVEVGDVGDNLLSDRNGDFEEIPNLANWDWSCQYEKPGNYASLPIISEVKQDPRDGNEENKALVWTLNPDVAASGQGLIMLNTNENGRVKVTPGKMYELSFYMKIADYVSPDDKLFSLNLDIYDYGSAIGAPNFPATLYRNVTAMSLADVYGTPGWHKITLPVAVPTDLIPSSGASELWITPRIIIRHPNYSADPGSGYSGTFSFDDFSLCEVGFDHISARLDNYYETGVGDTANLIVTPYTTTGNWFGFRADSATFSIADCVSAQASNPTVATIGTVESVVGLSSTNCYKASFPTEVLAEGEATAQVSMTIGGVTRTCTGNIGYYTTPFDSSLLTISDIPDKTYTGAEIKPSVSVIYDGELFEENVDYTVQYSDNIAAGNANIAITFLGRLSGVAEKSFNIVEDLMETSKTAITGDEDAPAYSLVFTHPVTGATTPFLYSSELEVYLAAFARGIDTGTLAANTAKYSETASEVFKFGVLTATGSVPSTIDAIIIQRIYNATQAPTYKDVIAGDVNADDTLDLVDAQAIIQNYVNGVTLPVLSIG